MSNEPGSAVPFEEIKRVEDEELARRRAKRNVAATPGTPVGLALSGGGIRSAAVCLGAIQALNVDKRFDGIDYLSTVSGGGYTGACLSAAMSDAGGAGFPFGADVKDSPVVAHIRNYSNYLLPRSRSALRNWSEAIVIILRGLLANAVCVLAFLLPMALLSWAAFPPTGREMRANFLPSLIANVARWCGCTGQWIDHVDQWPPFLVPAIVGALLVAVLLVWAMLRSRPTLDRATNDTTSFLLSTAVVLLSLLGVLSFLDLQPLVIDWFRSYDGDAYDVDLAGLSGILSAFGGVVSVTASSLGKFLKTSSRSTSWVTIGLRVATRAAVTVAALVLPFLIWLGYVAITAWLLQLPTSGGPLHLDKGWYWFLLIYAASIAITLGVSANGYSLHRLYRDRLSKAFLMATREATRAVASARLARRAARNDDLPPLDDLLLSTLLESDGPYPLINAALNVQGSLVANKRGREADFFLFTPQFVGSDLTDYAPTTAMEKVDSRLDVATAMAISGAAASANMGGNTIRSLSPTLSLLNIRLGYYLANPAYVGQETTSLGAVLRVGWANFMDRYYLLIEMFNGLTEKRRHIYLTDGGHIENLGIYALLRRHCRLIVAIDAEADPEIACESLLKVERFARIDLGIRIVLPWEAIRNQSAKTSDAIPGHDAPCDHGPHVAVGHILYPDGDPGLIVYVKASLSGDEKDYILDYAERNPSFPHETTGDQFFSEEQFEMYRALGFHMIDGVFGRDRLSFVVGGSAGGPNGPVGFPDEAAARAAIDAELPRRNLPPPAAPPPPAEPARRRSRLLPAKRKR